MEGTPQKDVDLYSLQAAVKDYFTQSGYATPEIECSSCRYCCTTGSHFKRCADCRVVRYCSKPCQKAHWPQHRQVCSMLNNVPLICLMRVHIETTKDLERLRACLQSIAEQCVKPSALWISWSAVSEMGIPVWNLFDKYATMLHIIPVLAEYPMLNIERFRVLVTMIKEESFFQLPGHKTKTTTAMPWIMFGSLYHIWHSNRTISYLECIAGAMVEKCDSDTNCTPCLVSPRAYFDEAIKDLTSPREIDAAVKVGGLSPDLSDYILCHEDYCVGLWMLDTYLENAPLAATGFFNLSICTFFQECASTVVRMVVDNWMCFRYAYTEPVLLETRTFQDLYDFYHQRVISAGLQVKPMEEDSCETNFLYHVIYGYLQLQTADVIKESVNCPLALRRVTHLTIEDCADYLEREWHWHEFVKSHKRH